MIINTAYNFNSISYPMSVRKEKTNTGLEVKNWQNLSKNINFDNYRSYIPQLTISFQGASSNLKKMSAVSPNGEKYCLEKNNDGSYLVDPETVTKIYYGKDAEKYLSKHQKFDLKTQIICPVDGEMLVKDTKTGKEIEIKSNGAIILDEGKEAKVTVRKGNPLVITSERKPVWYEEYCNNPKTKNQIDISNNLKQTYWHFYSGHIKISDIGDEIANKLIESEKAEFADNNYITMKHYYNPEYMNKDLANILNPEELSIFGLQYKKALLLRTSTKEAHKTFTDLLSDELKEKLIESKIVVDLSKSGDPRIYWNKIYAKEDDLRITLQNMDYTKQEQDEVIKFWKKTNKLGIDYTGLEYLSDGIAVYSLKNRVNNMTGGSQHWDTTSFVAASIKEDAKTPFISVSEKHSLKKYSQPTLYKVLRSSENLHAHPSELNLHQTELYIITEGAGALTVIENNIPKTIVLKQGEGVVLQPGVKHCVSAFKGQYEHLVCQIPCLFQYGVGVSKKDFAYPDGYSEKMALKSAMKMLKKTRI